MDKGRTDTDRMSYTPAQIADAVWTHATRTVDGLAPAASNGTPVDNIAYAIWTYTTRTASGGVATYQINVAQTMPAPSQEATAQTVMPVTVAQIVPAPAQNITAQTVMPFTVAQIVPAPVQTITAQFGAGFEINVNQTMPTPAQSATAAKKPLGAGGPRGAWEYRPPIFAIKTKGSEKAPPPTQAARVNAEPPRIIKQPEPEKPRFVYTAAQRSLMPVQGITVKSHRSKKIQRDEEEKILMLLMGVA